MNLKEKNIYLFFFKPKHRNKMATKIDMAEQQLQGFFHRERGFSLRDLIESMGLTKKEWEVIKNEYKPNYLNGTDVKEIDEIVFTKKNNK